MLESHFSLSFSNYSRTLLCAADLNLKSKWSGLLLGSLVFGPGGLLLGHFPSCFVYRGLVDLLGFRSLVDH